MSEPSSNPAIDHPPSAETVDILEFSSPGSRVRRSVSRVLFVALLLAGLVWGVREILHLKTPRPAPRPAPSAAVDPPEISPAPPAPSDPVSRAPLDPAPASSDAETDDGSLPGRRAHAFLRTRVEHFQDGETNLADLDQTVAHQAVSVVNLWATWCGPCKSELSDFRDMFVRNSAWGDETRFIAVMVDDPTTAGSAHRKFAVDMPPLHAFLADRGLGVGVRGALEAIDLLPPDAPLPVTLLFDCRRRIRWYRLGALDAPAFIILTSEIDALRAELGTASCKPPPRPARPATTDDPACDRDGECEPESGEDCDRCPRDCPCAAGRTCLTRPPPEISRCMENL